MSADFIMTMASSNRSPHATTASRMTGSTLLQDNNIDRHTDSPSNCKLIPEIRNIKVMCLRGGTIYIVHVYAIHTATATATATCTGINLNPKVLVHISQSKALVILLVAV